ncbi:hypothetical protein MLD38_006891 [Melastoma candidum]|uniref:Uncharacterized protein n=1 Tax=Melastoma candidum TaxID=119954 RepID=A0ACB9RNV3_9MYRT|nr:hypothetical protein MLD38_006891 [Melastoma candidum]
MPQKQGSDPAQEPKKRRRVGVSAVPDAGIDPNECISVYLVSKKEDVGTSGGFRLDPVDLGNFFEDDGKIYGYQGLKISAWISAVSFHAHAEVAFESSSDRGKGITDLKSALKNMFGETLLDDKDEFIQTFSTDSQYVRSSISSGDILHMEPCNRSAEDSNTILRVDHTKVEVVRMVMGNMAAGHLYSRLVPLVLLLVDGSNPIDVTDSSWELYVLIKKVPGLKNSLDSLLGFAALYRFYHHPDSTRLRLGQILVLPPYQHEGHGRFLLEVLNYVAVRDDVYDLTIEEPLEYLQRLRTSMDILRLLISDKVQLAVESTVSQLKQEKLLKKLTIPKLLPPKNLVEDVRKAFKINKKQFLQCWEILIYIALAGDKKHIQEYNFVVSNRVRTEILGKDSVTPRKRVIDVPSKYHGEMSFVMYKAEEGEDSANGVTVLDRDKRKQEEQLQQLVDERLKEIESIAEKVSRHRS